MKYFIVGAFTAASNVTGVVVQINEITALLHTYDALAVWDYAAGAPHIPVNMNPPADTHSNAPQDIYNKDAVFFSPHKFIGGPGESTRAAHALC